jgi:hypothetical protein
LTAWIRTEADFAWWQPHVLHPLDPFSSGPLSGGYSRPAPAEGSEIALTTFAGILTIILMTAPEAYAGTWQAVEAGL